MWGSVSEAGGPAKPPPFAFPPAIAHPHAVPALPGLIFFASGFAALVYQIVWQRLLVIFSGSDVHSATVIVAAFMAGLGCGSLAGAQVADRLPRRANLACFAAAELAVGVFGFFSADLYYGVLYQRFGHLMLGAEARAAMLFVSLLWPTFFMGVSLPLLARALTPEIGRAARITGRLYACNTAGAAAGAFVSTWVLLPAYGLEGTLQISAVVNIAAAAGVWPLLSSVDVPRADPSNRDRDRPPRHPAPADVEPPATDRPDAFRVPFAVWALVYAMSGFLALSLEIVWFRLLGVMLKSTASTFGTLLSIYLTGIGLGAALGTALGRRTRVPAHVFLVMQSAACLYAGLGVTVLLATIADWRSLAWLSSYFGSYEPIDARAEVGRLALALRGGGDLPRAFLLLYVVLPSVLILPPTLLMGASFPLLLQATQTDLARLGRRVGGLLAANIAGSALGSIVTGWMSLAWLGSSGTLKMLVAASTLFPMWGLVLSTRTSANRWRASTYAGLIVAAACLFVLMPDGPSLWARFHGSTPAFVQIGEDGSGTSVLRTVPGREPRVVVFANGVGQSWIPYGGIHTVLGALPAFIHPHPRSAAIIGLGSGDTVFGVAGRRDLERITCVEIIRPQLTTLRHLLERWRYPGLVQVLTDPRIEHVYGDGRLHLMHAQRAYDIIEADALRPTSAYAGLLYSDAYFAAIRDRLTPGGLAVTWSPSPRVHNTFLTVFPHVLSYGDIVLGSNEPIAFDADAIRARLAHPEARAYFADAVVDIEVLLAPYLDTPPRVYGPADDRSALTDINTDLFPKDELSVPLQP
jgi:spermidine synthase